MMNIIVTEKMIPFKELKKKVFDYVCEMGRMLIDTIERYTDGMIMAEPVQEILRLLSVAKSPKKDGKGNPYIDILNHHMPMLEAIQTNARKAFRKAFCG